VQYLLFYAEIIDKNRKNCAYADLGHITGCRDEARVERIALKAEIQWTEAVSDGPVPELHTDSEEEEPKEAEEPIKPGDRIFAIGLVPAPAEIRATSSVLGQLRNDLVEI